MTNQPTTTKEALEPCPWCKAVPRALGHYFEVFHPPTCFFAEFSGALTRKCIYREQFERWNSYARITASIVAPEVDDDQPCPDPRCNNHLGASPMPQCVTAVYWSEELMGVVDVLRQFSDQFNGIDNGRCTVCRVGHRLWRVPGKKKGACDYEQCLSHRVDAILERYEPPPPEILERIRKNVEVAIRDRQTRSTISIKPADGINGLRQCPFCGADAEEQVHNGRGWLGCPSCCIGNTFNPPYGDNERAAWNRRTHGPASTVAPQQSVADYLNEDRCMFCGGKTGHKPDCDHGVATTPPPSTLAKAAQEIANERARQVAVEGWTVEHDDEHEDGELARAANCYRLIGNGSLGEFLPDADQSDAQVPTAWPWDDEWWKPKTRLRNLIRAGALYQAEIERLIRARDRVTEEAQCLIDKTT